MQTDPDNYVKTRLAQAIAAAEDDLRLRNDNPHAAARLVTQAQQPRSRRGIAAWAIAVALALFGSGAAAVAIELRSDPTSDEFTRLHPDKSQIDATHVEPHILVGEVALADGTKVRLLVTTAGGTKVCANTQQISANGTKLGSVGFCREVSSASLELVNGALVGYVPSSDTAMVRVTGTGPSTEVKVIHQFFLVTPELARPGSTARLTSFTSTGAEIGTSLVVVGPR